MKWLRISGNPAALARWAVALTLLVGALLATKKWDVSPGVIVGSFLGAALSLIVNWIVPILEREKEEKLPFGLLTAANRDLSDAQYYRTKQEIVISVRYDANIDADVVELCFSATLKPAQPNALVLRQTIEPPFGTQLLSATYRVGDKVIPEGGSTNLTGTEEDCLKVRYQIVQPLHADITDIHLWPSPVVDFTVTFELNDGYELDVMKVITATRDDPLSRHPLDKTGGIEFRGGGAFTGQSIKWALRRRVPFPAS